LPLPVEAHERAQTFIREKDLTDKHLIGIHPGSSIERGMILKRWPRMVDGQIKSVGLIPKLLLPVGEL